MRRKTRLSLVQIVACRLYGAKPLIESIIAYCQLGPWERVLLKFESEHINLIKENAHEYVVCIMGAIWRQTNDGLL